MDRFSHKPERPLSPNIQIYRPQLTSVLSIVNRIAGIVLSLGAVILVILLLAAASGPEAYSYIQVLIHSWPGMILLVGATFAFFLHLCGGIRHLIWDNVRAFTLGQIYASGWVVVLASAALTAASLLIGLTTGHH